MKLMKRSSILAAFAIAAAEAGCRRAGSATGAPAPPPATVKTVNEADLAGVVLSADAERRLGIETARVTRGRFQRTRLFAGEAMVPPGRSVTLAAPLPGSIGAPGEGGPPPPGARLKRGQAVFRLVPLWSPSEGAALARAVADISAAKLDADAAIRTSSVELEAARTALERAEKLLGDRAGSARGVDEAKARVRLAEAALAAAEARRAFLAQVSLDPGSSAGLDLVSPLDGILVDAMAAPGQTVTAGAPLFTVSGMDPIGVRVRVYAGDLPSIDRAKPARVAALGISPGKTRDARPAAAPPAARALEATVDLHYEMENADGSVIPGQRLEAALFLGGEEERLSVPASALVLDYHGGSWVYVRAGPSRYARRRVEVLRSEGDTAVLASGPPEGVEVVKAGAMELFGTELGFSK